MMNDRLKLAWSFVNKTNRNVFLTGKAGTGKTTFLHKLKQHSNKRLVVVAPTAVAAINANGVTIHSFFQLPFGPILPNQDLHNNSKFGHKFNKTKINIIKSLDLLIIDEISMVRADVLDAIDSILRRYKNKHLSFGGVQLLMIGDLQQLSPVVKDNEWTILSQFYENCFFFSSKAYKQSDVLTIELKHIYRQKNQAFIDILNEIRNNKLSIKSSNLLNQRYLPDFVPGDDEGYISLTTHNHKAFEINQKKLDALTGESFIYQAIIDGDFPEQAYPNELRLELKVGAQVMFIKNDSSSEKKYFNGKIGKVIDLDRKHVVVRCPDDNFDIIVNFDSWEYVKYSLDPSSKEIVEHKIGSFTQIPLRLAWSITIHKSQGLTFEKAIIDANSAFAHGQTYVALSRCKSLEGLVLRSKILPEHIITDDNVMLFNKLNAQNQPNETILRKSRRDFQLNLISELFNFYDFLPPLKRLLNLYYKNKNSIEGNVEVPLKDLKETVTNLIKVRHKFDEQLQSLVGDLEIPEEHEHLQERFVKAVKYFSEQAKSKMEEHLSAVQFTTDSKKVEDDFMKQLDILEQQLMSKLMLFEGLKDKFNTDILLKLKADVVFLSSKKTKRSQSVAEGTSNVELFELLRNVRHQMAMRYDLRHFQVFTQKSLYAMCEVLPTTKQELLAIPGMGKSRVKKYGEEILEVIIKYINDKGIEVTNKIVEPTKPKRKKGDSKKLSLEMFLKGMSIEQIADDRELNTNTIFGHLASFIPSGEIKITDLMSEESYQELKQIIPTKTFETLSDLKHQLDDKYSYAEIRLVLDELSKQ